MITVLIQGGLGNQMFQYSLALALRHRGHRVKIDISNYNYYLMHNGYELERVFKIKEDAISKSANNKWQRILKIFKIKCLYLNDKLAYNECLLNNPPYYIDGYWQNEKYFLDIKNTIISTFTFKDIDEDNMNIAKGMKDCNSVSLHVRRGDYKDFGMLIISYSYYEKAVDYIKKNVETPYFYIFSDDKEEAKVIADKLNIKYSIVSINSGKDSYKDMFLMSQCKHNVIANSSFSWWGAWLNRNKNKIVISPDVWSIRNPHFKPQADGWISIMN